jgi:hypothetical protein
MMLAESSSVRGGWMCDFGDESGCFSVFWIWGVDSAVV